MEWFDIFVMLRFTNNSDDLNKKFERYNLASIQIDEGAKEYLCKIIPNLATANCKNKLNTYHNIW